MYRILNFYTIIFSILFFQKINFKMVKCENGGAEREKTNVIDTNVAVE
jgi:hypothetical protein